VEVRPGRYTADIDGDFVVFLIGTRVNRPMRIRKWWPVAAAMPKMLKVLSQHPELGCLGFQKWFGGRHCWSSGGRLGWLWVASESHADRVSVPLDAASTLFAVAIHSSTARSAS